MPDCVAEGGRFEPSGPFESRLKDSLAERGEFELSADFTIGQ
jgi:hypothetical protein